MSKVVGEDWVIRIFDAGIWKPYVCARSGSISIDTEMLNTSVTGTGNGPSRRPANYDFSGQLDGVISLNEAGSLSLPELQALQLSNTQFLARFEETSQNGDIYVKQAYFYINSSTDTGSFDGVATFSISLVGNGAITQIFTPVDPVIEGKMYRYPAQGNTAPVTPGTTVITVAGLGNKNMIGIFKDGIGNNDIITSGTPVDKEVLYETVGSDGRFTWAIPFDGENWFCQYQNI